MYGRTPSPRRQARIRAGSAFTLAAALAGAPAAASAQSILDRSPNLGQEWGGPGRHLALVLTHRFEFMNGGDHLLNVPTLTLGVPVSARVAIGLDFTSNSEVGPALGGNETQYWLTGTLVHRERAGLAATAAYNTAAGSADGGLVARVGVGGLTLLAGGRLFSDVLAGGAAGGGFTGGAVFRPTSMLALSADFGRMLRPDSIASVWSAGVAVAIPGSRHTLSLHATNGGATTLQGTLRPRVLGTESVRYGFSFTAPLGSRAQWARVFRNGGEAAPAADGAAAGSALEIVMADLAFAAPEVRIRAGDSVEWVNRDAVVHTVTADDGAWGSTLIPAGGRYIHRFPTPGRYPYHCLPHPHMRGVVIVE